MNHDSIEKERIEKTEKNKIFIYGLLTGCFFWVGFGIAMAIILNILY